MKNTAPPLPAEHPGGSGTEPVLSFTGSGPQDKYTTASPVALDNICPHIIAQIRSLGLSTVAADGAVQP